MLASMLFLRLEHKRELLCWSSVRIMSFLRLCDISTPSHGNQAATDTRMEWTLSCKSTQDPEATTMHAESPKAIHMRNVQEHPQSIVFSKYADRRFHERWWAKHLAKELILILSGNTWIEPTFVPNTFQVCYCISLTQLLKTWVCLPSSVFRPTWLLGHL